MDEQEALAHNLIKLRKAAGLTQLELAEKIKYSNKTISKWERGESYPDIFTLKKMADVYGVTVNDIIEGIVPKSAGLTLVDKKDPKYQFNLAMLIMACALLFCLTLVAFFLLTFLVGAGKTPDGVIYSAVSAQGYGYWNFFIYNIPLDALAVFVFLLVLYRRADQISLSLILWGVLCSIHLSVMQYEPMIALLYLCGVPFQILLSTFCRFLNISLRSKDMEIKEKPTTVHNETEQ